MSAALARLLLQREARRAAVAWARVYRWEPTRGYTTLCVNCGLRYGLHSHWNRCPAEDYEPRANVRVEWADTRFKEDRHA